MMPASPPFTFFSTSIINRYHVYSLTFDIAPFRRPRINLIRIEEELSEVHLRLVNATIENLPWQDFTKRYDRKQTFFYLDPPYYLAPEYNHNLELEDYSKMADILGGLKAKFILSINDLPEMRETFKGFKIKSVTLKYSVAEKQSTVGKELLISNF